MRTSLRTVIATLILFGPAANGYSQSATTEGQQSPATSQSATTLRTSTRLVIVDVVATDSKGQPVTDLKAEDFTMLEDTKAQQISSFAFQHPGPAPVTAALQLPPGVVTNAPQYQSSSLNVILLDTLNGDFAEQAYAKDQLVKYFAGAQISRPIALFVLSDRLVLLHDFTTDSAALKSVLEKFKPPARTNNADTTLSRASAFTTHGDFHTSEQTIESTLNQLNALAKTLTGYSGRKNLIWVSESFPVNLFPDFMTAGASSIPTSNVRGAQSPAAGTIGRASLEGSGQGAFKDYALLIKKVSDSLMAAQVAVYAVDASAVGKDERLAAQHTMNEMAERTGGKAFHNTNDLVTSMRTSIDDGATYYTLEYYPDNKKWDGQFRTIQVKSSRPGVNLRYRLGYYALSPETVNKEESDKVAENFSRSLQMDAPGATAVRFQAGVLPPSDKTNNRVAVIFAIDPHTIAFERRNDGSEHARVSCTIWAYAKDKDKPIMSNGKSVNADLAPDVYQKMMAQYLPCKQELDLKSGTYTLRLGVLDRTTNLIGTTTAQVIVP
jgi:VWFA-related protein